MYELVNNNIYMIYVKDIFVFLLTYDNDRSYVYDVFVQELEKHDYCKVPKSFFLYLKILFSHSFYFYRGFFNNKGKIDYKSFYKETLE